MKLLVLMFSTELQDKCMNHRWLHAFEVRTTNKEVKENLP